MLELVHQEGRERRADHGAAAEAHDGHAGRHAAPVGEPFDERRDRRDVAEAEADAADDARAEPHQPQLMDVDAQAAEISRPPHQHSAETKPALRGPARSSQPPQIAAETPSSTKKNVYIQPRSNWLQLQSVAMSACSVPAAFSPNVTAPAEHSGSGLAVGADERALQRLPEHREAVGHADAQWMHSAAGGTSQRLKPGLAMMRSLESSAGPAAPTLAVLAIVVSFPRSRFFGGST